MRRCEALRDQPLRILQWREVQKRWKCMQNKRQERARLQAAMAPTNETANGMRWSGRGPSECRSFTFTDLRFPGRETKDRQFPDAKGTPLAVLPRSTTACHAALGLGHLWRCWSWRTPD
jgi:hypothetical protein